MSRDSLFTRIAAFCTVTGLILFFIGCASFIPKPASEDDTLVVVQTVTQKAKTTTISFPVNLKVTMEKDGKEHVIYLVPTKKYEYIHHLEPGTYLIKKYGIVSTNESTPTMIRFTVKRGRLQVAPFYVLVRYMTKEDMIYYAVTLEKLNFRQKAEIIEELRNDENTALWEIDYSVDEE
ncbi:MAG: hypothetical protein JW881_06010 [Spirochaetales bacterium]|nr:hypothetical protein [Spirochaetales bacterium]